MTLLHTADGGCAVPRQRGADGLVTPFSAPSLRLVHPSALAAVAATGAAFAQSSVTLYGVADAGVTKITGTSLKMSSSGAMNNGNSRWGVRGTEDLGGGLTASFNFEQGLSLDDGSAGSSGGPFGRAAYMALGGGFGEISLGRRLNPAFFTAAAWELSGTANYSAVVSQFGTVLGGIRENDMIMYTSPNFGGVTVQFAHVLKGDTGSKAVNDVSVRYVAGPLVVAANYNQQDTSVKNAHLGASYNFGAFKVAGAWIDPTGVSKGFTIGASAPFGPLNLTVDMARDNNAKDTDLLVEAKYALSKRTTAYAAYLKDGDKKAGGLGGDKTGLGVGIRHNF